MIYTQSEQTIRKYTEEDIAEAVKIRLGKPVRFNVLAYARDCNMAYTLQELNRIADEVAADYF